MAQKRQFSIAVTETDAFLDMPLSSQALYFHLGMYGDDDGFVGSPRKISRSAGCNDDDMRVLISNGFVIPFDSGVVVLRDWNINNTLKNDRYHETIYRTEKSMLQEDESGRYVLGTGLEPTWNQTGTMLEPELNVTKLNITEHREGADKPPRASRFTPPTVEEVSAYCRERGNHVDAQRFIDHYSANGWMVGKNRMKDWRASVRTWERSEYADKPKAGDRIITSAKASKTSLDALDALMAKINE